MAAHMMAGHMRHCWTLISPAGPIPVSYCRAACDEPHCILHCLECAAADAAHRPAALLPVRTSLHEARSASPATLAWVGLATSCPRSAAEAMPVARSTQTKCCRMTLRRSSALKGSRCKAPSQRPRRLHQRIPASLGLPLVSCCSHTQEPNPIRARRPIYSNCKLLWPCHAALL